MLQDIPLDTINIRDDARAIDLATVAALVDSIGTVGLINPIRVRAAGAEWELVAGAHRFTACKQLGLVEITCQVVNDDDLHAELAMIDENLCRAELSPSDRARQTARRKAIYLELHPETGHGKASPSKEENISSFATETATKTGQTDRSVRMHAERGEKVIDEALDMIRGTKLDTGTYLDRLKKMTPNEQVTAVKRDLALMKQSERDKQRNSVPPQRSKIDADVKQRAAKEIAEILAENVPGEWWDAVKANLYAAGASNIAHEFTNITGQSVMDRGAA